MGLHLGQYYYPSTLPEALEKKVELSHVITIHASGLRLIPASISPKIVDFDVSEFRDKLKGLGGYILVDSPPGLDNHARKILKTCDSVLIVVVPELTSVTDAMKIKCFAEALGKEVKGVVLNRYGSSKYDLKTREIEAGFNLPIIGKIPEDEGVKKSFFKGEPLYQLTPYSKGSLAFKKLGAKILGKNYKPERLSTLKRWKNKLFK